MKALQNTYLDNLKIKPSKERRKYDKDHVGYRKSSGKWNPVKLKEPKTWNELLNCDRLIA
jgi:hypothetical protein